MTLEEKILAYLDGGLDEESSEELLHSLSISPEKRAVLEEHLSLRNMLALGQKPFGIPATVERSLAERIPALSTTETSARVARTGTFASLFSGASEWIAGLVQAPAVRWGAGLASLAAVGISFWMLGGSPSSNVNRVMTGSSKQIASTDIPSSSSVGSEHGQPQSSLDHTRTYSTETNRTGLRRADRPPTQRVWTHANSSAATLSNSAGPAQTELDGIIATTAARPSATSTIPAPASVVPARFSPSQFTSRESYKNLRLTVAFGQYQYSLPDVGGKQSAGLTRPEVALSYDLTHSLALRLEGGTSLHPAYGLQAKNERVTSISGQSYTRVVYSTSLQPTEALFTRLGFEYTLNRGDSYELHLSSTGGVQFASSLMPIASIGAGITHPLNSLLSLDLSATAIGSWGSGVGSVVADSTAPSASGPVGVVHRNVNVGGVFASALGVRAGLRYQF